MASDGTAEQIPPGMLKSTCQINIKWFPFDDQVRHQYLESGGGRSPMASLGRRTPGDQHLPPYHGRFSVRF